MLSEGCVHPPFSRKWLLKDFPYPIKGELYAVPGPAIENHDPNLNFYPYSTQICTCAGTFSFFLGGAKYHHFQKYIGHTTVKISFSLGRTGTWCDNAAFDFSPLYERFIRATQEKRLF